MISASHYKSLRKNFPGIVAYAQADGRVKLAAGWLIDYLGFKGHQENGVGVYEKQALVLTHNGQSNSHALLTLAEKIRSAVYSKFHVQLKIEPQIWPHTSNTAYVASVIHT